MEIKKKKGTFNTYVCEVSFGQLTAFRNALANDHLDALADETYAELNWYLENVPGPGEDEDDLKAQEQAGASGMASPEAAQKPLSPKADDLLPAPGEEEGGEQPPGPKGPPGDEAGPPGEEGLPGEGAPEEVPPGEEGPPGPEDEADRRLPPPPEE